MSPKITSIGAEYHFEQFMLCLGLNPADDPQLRDTPARFTKMICEATKNYRKEPTYTTAAHYDPSREIKATLFPAPVATSLVTERDLSFSSICAHHFAPFFGKCHIGYLPGSEILGISKFARILDFYCLRPQTQEMLTTEIAEEIQRLTRSDFVAVMMEAEHTCLSCRGPRKQGAQTITSHFVTLKGAAQFETTKSEFLRFVCR